MNSHRFLTAATVALALLASGPAFADKAHGKGHGGKHAHQDHPHHRHARKHDHDKHGHRHGKHARQVEYRYLDCPPGLAKKDPACVPPGQARKIVRDYGLGVGQILPRDRYIRISDPYRYDLEPRPGWDYYRGDDAIYRVDSSTRKILAVLNLISAFSN